MAFVDELEIRIQAGKGGDGVVRWRREKFVEFGGPAGGNGGKGGDVYALGVRDVMYLSKYQQNQLFAAQKGEDGGSSSREGKNGEDLFVRLPVGSVLLNLETGEERELAHEGQQILLARGGRGGYGNEHFKGSTNQRPREVTLGKEGEVAKWRVELRLFAEIGFIGLPNAGKTSLLNALTNADKKVGNYAFTTLDPNLGALNGRILADIPGIIEGAAEGKGLGHKFLKHISRTRMLLHCISSERENMTNEYQIVRSELGKFDTKLLQKEEIILITKTDTITQEELDKKIGELSKAAGKEILTVSIIDDASIASLKERLLKLV